MITTWSSLYCKSILLCVARGATTSIKTFYHNGLRCLNVVSPNISIRWRHVYMKHPSCPAISTHSTPEPWPTSESMDWASIVTALVVPVIQAVSCVYSYSLIQTDTCLSRPLPDNINLTACQLSVFVWHLHAKERAARASCEINVETLVSILTRRDRH